jgi:hypothetical protein
VGRVRNHEGSEAVFESSDEMTAAAEAELVAPRAWREAGRAPMRETVASALYKRSILDDLEAGEELGD